MWILCYYSIIKFFPLPAYIYIYIYKLSSYFDFALNNIKVLELSINVKLSSHKFKNETSHVRIKFAQIVKLKLN